MQVTYQLCLYDGQVVCGKARGYVVGCKVMYHRFLLVGMRCGVFVTGFQ